MHPSTVSISITITHAICMKELSCTSSSSDVTIDHLLRTSTGYITSSKEIRVSIFNACWAKTFRNSILSKEVFRLLAPLISTNDLNELAKHSENVL